MRHEMKQKNEMVMNVKWHVLVCTKEKPSKGCIVCFTIFYSSSCFCIGSQPPFKLQIIKASKCNPVTQSRIMVSTMVRIFVFFAIPTLISFFSHTTLTL